jgi:hypothetical protein
MQFVIFCYSKPLNSGQTETILVAVLCYQRQDPEAIPMLKISKLSKNHDRYAPWVQYCPAAAQAPPWTSLYLEAGYHRLIVEACSSNP